MPPEPAFSGWPASRQALARLFRVLRVLKWLAPSSRSQAVKFRSYSGIASAGRPECLYAVARLFREARVWRWSAPSSRSRAARVRSTSGIASATRPASR